MFRSADGQLMYSEVNQDLLNGILKRQMERRRDEDREAKKRRIHGALSGNKECTREQEGKDEVGVDMEGKRTCDDADAAEDLSADGMYCHLYVWICYLLKCRIHADCKHL